MSLGTLTIDLAANVAGLESDLGKAQRVFDKNSRDFQRTAAGIAKVTAGVAAAVAVGFAAMVKSSIDTADALMDVSESSGIAVEQLSALKLAADIEGISIEQLSGSFNKFNKAVVSAVEEVGTGADAFKALGINVKGADGALKDNYTLIEEVADALSQLENGAQKTALAQDLFGKSGVKLLPILNGGKQGLQDFSKEAERMGLIISGKTAADAGVFNDNLTRLRLSFVGLSNTVAGQVTDDLADFTSVLTDPATQQGIASIASGLFAITTKAVEAVAAIGGLTKFIAESVSKAANGIDLSSLVDVEDELSTIRDLIENPITSRLNPLLPTRLAFMNKDELVAEMEKLVKQRDDLINSFVPPLIPTAVGANNAGTKTPNIELIDTTEIDEKIQKLQAQINDSFKSQAEGYARQIALTGEVTELERVRFEYASGSLVGIDEKQKIILENLAMEVDAINLAAKAEADRKAIETKLVADLEAARSSLLTQEEALIKAAEERMKVLQAAYAAGKIGEQEMGELSRRNGEELNKSLDDLKNKTTELSEFTKELYRGVQNSIADAIVNGIKGGSGNALEAFRDLLIRMAAEAAAANITQWIFSGSQSSGGGGSGSGANTVGILSTVASWFGGGRAVGGPVQAGRMYEVGENNRPELFMANGRQYMIPGNSGSVVPGGGGGGNVININMSGVTNAKEGREAAGAIARKVSSAVAAGQRYS